MPKSTTSFGEADSTKPCDHGQVTQSESSSAAFRLQVRHSHENCRSVQVSPSAGAMSATLHASPSWLGSLAQSSPSPIDTQFATFTAKTSSLRTRGTFTAGLFDDDKYRAGRSCENKSLDDELADLEGIGIATNGAWSITINEGSRTRLRARKVRSGAAGGASSCGC